MFLLWWWVFNTAVNSTLTFSPLEQETLERVAAQEFCGCNSSKTLLQCWQQPQPQSCQLAQKMRTILGRMVQQGATPGVLERYASEQLLGPFCSPPQTLLITNAPSKKGALAKPTPASRIDIIEFADFRCSHCREMWPHVEALLATLGRNVHFTYVPLALGDHPFSIAAAEAALAAHAQGKFWPMAQALFGQAEGNFTPEILVALAKKTALNLKSFRTALASHRYRPQLKIWQQAALAANLTGTPTFYINGRVFIPDPQQSLQDRLELELQRNESACN